MDLRTGRVYATKEEALAAGVPESDVAEVVIKDLSNLPLVRFSKGPFKGRQYRRVDDGHLERVK